MKNFRTPEHVFARCAKTRTLSRILSEKVFLLQNNLASLNLFQLFYVEFCVKKEDLFRSIRLFLFNKIARVQKKIITFITAFIFSVYAVASQAEVKSLGDMAITITQSFYGLSKLITAGAYMAGMGFVMASMMKFKAHKDNPTQIPIGTPIALLFVGSALIFLPNIFSIAGQTIFGDTSGAAGIYGTTGLDVNL